MATATENLYPEHEKLKAINVQTQAIGEFLEEGPYIVAEYVTLEDHSEPTLVPVTKSRDQILADFFDIDRSALEAEKKAMLATLSEFNG